MGEDLCGDSAGASTHIADSARLIFLRRGLTASYRMCGSARDGVAVAAYAQGLSGRDGVSLAGAGELAAEPAVLVQAAAGGLDPLRLRHPADPYGVKPADRDDPLDRRECTVVVAGVEQHRPAGSPVRAGGE